VAAVQKPPRGHHTNDLKLFFAWAGKPPTAITLHDVDVYIHHCRRLGHAVATVNRRGMAVLFGGVRRRQSTAMRPTPEGTMGRGQK
jgi:hypothetical protein